MICLALKIHHIAVFYKIIVLQINTLDIEDTFLLMKCPTCMLY